MRGHDLPIAQTTHPASGWTTRLALRSSASVCGYGAAGEGERRAGKLTTHADGAWRGGAQEREREEARLCVWACVPVGTQTSNANANRRRPVPWYKLHEPSATGEANVVEEATTWAEQMSVQAGEGGMVMNERWTTNERIGRWVNRHGLGGNEAGERSAERWNRGAGAGDGRQEGDRCHASN
ncbi:hypothetical protein AB1N83_007593 [Pleurotus pulmonarius]